MVEDRNNRYQHAPEDFDVVCEVCGTKWDFIDDKAVCPVCGDTLNKVEIATLKEEAYIRRRQREMNAQGQTTKGSKKASEKHGPKREKKLMKWVSFIAVFGVIAYCFYKFCPEYCEPILEFFKGFMK